MCFENGVWGGTQAEVVVNEGGQACLCWCVKEYKKERCERDKIVRNGEWKVMEEEMGSGWDGGCKLKGKRNSVV